MFLSRWPLSKFRDRVLQPVVHLKKDKKNIQNWIKRLYLVCFFLNLSSFSNLWITLVWIQDSCCRSVYGVNHKLPAKSLPSIVKINFSLFVEADSLKGCTSIASPLRKSARSLAECQCLLLRKSSSIFVHKLHTKGSNTKTFAACCYSFKTAWNPLVLYCV